MAEIVPPQVPQVSPTSGKAPKGLSFYRIKKLSEVVPGRFNLQITKFDSDLNVESSYAMNFLPSGGGGYYDCQCPASKFDCRHKQILQAFEQAGELDGEKFYCFEAKTFKSAQEIA